MSLFGTLVGMQPFFGGMDPVQGKPWYHETLTWEAAQRAGWTRGGGETDYSTAAAALAWHADYVDSYLYNPLWWALGGPTRFAASLVHHDDLIKLHFDDLQSTRQIMLMWNRYLGGTVAGVAWAADRGDVAAARNVLGAGLHAIQDFYSHSNWVDDPPRRAHTWTSAGPKTAGAPDPREPLHLYTGAYEKPAQASFKSHGIYTFDCAIMRRLLPATLMDAMCSGISPLSNTGMCRRWRECQGAESPRPETIAGVKVPPDVLYVLPPGIALDSPFLFPQGRIEVPSFSIFNLASAYFQ